jgi:hypothetical protein
MAYTTTAELKAYMNITASSDDTQLGYAVTRAQAMVDQVTHRTFEASADTTRTYTPLLFNDGGDLMDYDTLYLGADLYSLTSITNGDGNAVTLTDVVLLPSNVKPVYGIKIKRGVNLAWNYTTSPENAVSVTGKFAYSLTAPADIIAATLRIAAYLYRQREGTPDSDRAILSADGMVLASPQIPKDVVTLLRPYVRRSL